MLCLTEGGSPAVTCVCRLEELQASFTAQAAKQASLEEQLAEAQERLAMEDGNKVRVLEEFAPMCTCCSDMRTHCIAVACEQQHFSAWKSTLDNFDWRVHSLL